MDKLVGMVCLFAGGVFLGMIIAEEKAAVALQPCPKQAGYHHTSSVWSQEHGLQCRYEPEIRRVK